MIQFQTSNKTLRAILDDDLSFKTHIFEVVENLGRYVIYCYVLSIITL